MCDNPLEMTYERKVGLLGLITNIQAFLTLEGENRLVVSSVDLLNLLGSHSFLIGCNSTFARNNSLVSGGGRVAHQVLQGLLNKFDRVIKASVVVSEILEVQLKMHKDWETAFDGKEDAAELVMSSLASDIIKIAKKRGEKVDSWNTKGENIEKEFQFIFQFIQKVDGVGYFSIDYHIARAILFSWVTLFLFEVSKGRLSVGDFMFGVSQLKEVVTRDSKEVEEFLPKLSEMEIDVCVVFSLIRDWAVILGQPTASEMLERAFPANDGGCKDIFDMLDKAFPPD